MKGMDIRADGTGDAIPRVRQRRRWWSLGLGCAMRLAGCTHGLTLTVIRGVVPLVGLLSFWLRGQPA